MWQPFSGRSQVSGWNIKLVYNLLSKIIKVATLPLRLMAETIVLTYRFPYEFASFSSVFSKLFAMVAPKFNLYCNYR